MTLTKEDILATMFQAKLLSNCYRKIYDIAPTAEVENEDVHTLFEVGIVLCEKVEYLEDCFGEVYETMP
jgi:hypothetical protein